MKPLKCVKCNQDIEVDINNITSISRFKNQYYHTQCLRERAERAINRPNHKSCWDNALNNIDAYEQEAREFIERKYWNDNLNDYLLCNYGVTIIPDRFWEMVRELNKQDDIDYSFYDKLVNDAVETISKYGDFEWFVSDDPYISPPFVGGKIKPDFMLIPDDSPEEVPFR